jgi:hypothetical protein
MFFKDKINSTLNSLVENKRIVIAGPAYSLTGKSQGAIIDDYDIVVRTNQFAVPKNSHKDYGARTDIMFHNCGTPWLPGLKEMAEKNPDELKALKMVVCPIIKADHSEVNFHLWPDDHISACAYNFKNISTEIPFYWIGVRNYMEVYRTVGCEPYTGVMTICTLLHYPIKELYVTGFDFYSEKKVYCEGITPSVDAAAETRNVGGSHGPGCNEAQIMFLKDLCHNSSKLLVDDKIKEILYKK